jgi:hypothetical protein
VSWSQDRRSVDFLDDRLPCELVIGVFEVHAVNAQHLGRMSRMRIRLVDVTMPCAVLEDGTRVLTQSDFMTAMGMYYSGWVANNAPDISEMAPAVIPHFLAQKTLIPFVNKHLGHLQDIVLKYRTAKGTMAHGIRAEIIPSICDIYRHLHNGTSSPQTSILRRRGFAPILLCAGGL